MSSSINLISDNKDQLEKELRKLKILKISAIFSLAIVVFMSVVVFILNFTLPISSVKKDERQTLDNIALLRQKLVKYSLINDRARNISDLISKRKKYDSSSETILGKLPADLTVSALEVESDTIKISVTSDSLIPMDQFINDVIELGNQAKTIKNISILSLILNGENGKYTLSLQGDLP